MTNRRTSTRCMLYQRRGGMHRLGIYKNYSSGKLFYGSVDGECHAENRIRPDRVWIDEDGFICVDVERRQGDE